MKAALLFIGCFLVAFRTTTSLSCIRPCSRLHCSTPVDCKGGTVKDICGCCTVCAKVEGERCGGQWQTEGRCDSGLKCSVRDGRLKAGVGLCEPATCREKKCGFREVCTLSNDGFPLCSCRQDCGNYKHKPVCGYSNGKQYNKRCDLHREECTTGRVIGVMQGPCKKCYHGNKTYLFGETRKGKNPCENCNCLHGEWKCRRTSQCEQQKPRSCTVIVDSLGRSVESDCPRGFWCKVQIPGIPDAGIPEVAVCVPGEATDGQAIVTTTASTSAARLQGREPPAQCLEQPSVGPCKAAFRRWYYNKAKRKCAEFLYGGCLGNNNNFYTKTACKNFCMQRNRSSEQVVRHTSSPEMEKTSTPEPPIEMWTEVCILPAVTGPCRASFTRWHFNSFIKKCIKFMYGGCNGNMNNFRTKAECKKHCMKRRIRARARTAVLWYAGALRRRSATYGRSRQG